MTASDAGMTREQVETIREAVADWIPQRVVRMDGLKWTLDPTDALAQWHALCNLALSALTAAEEVPEPFTASFALDGYSNHACDWVVKGDYDRLRARLAEVKAERDGAMRGEFICTRCGIRQGGQHDEHPDF